MQIYKRWEDVVNLLHDNKDMKKMFADMKKLQKDMDALQKKMKDFKINYK